MPPPRRKEAAIFKRKHTYLMQIDGEINYPLDEMRRGPTLAALPDDELRAAMAESLIRQVMEVAREELERHGLKLKRRIKQPGGDRQKETGSEIMVNQLGEHHVTFSVAFEGDYEAAVAATDRWVERVRTFGGIAGIGHVSLRGTDGTNVHAFDEEIEELAGSLDEETLARIDEIMDPNRGSDV